MGLSSGTVWECRATGNDLNGGGFVAGASGLDYSQQDAPQLIINDASSSGSPTVRTGSGGFTAAMIGNVAQVSGGTLTPGFYQITSISNANTVIFDRAPGSGSGSTIRVGGALASLGVLSGAMIASNKAFVKGPSGNVSSAYTSATTITFPGSVSPSATTPPSRLIGYATTRGDAGRFVLQLTSNTVSDGGSSPITALNFTGGGWIVEGATVDCGNVASSTGISLAGGASDCRRCKVLNFTTCGINVPTADTAVSDCEITAGGSASIGISAGAANIKILRCHLHDNAGVGIAATSDDLIAWNIVANNAGGTSDGIRIGAGSVVLNNTIHNNGRHGINKIDANFINGQIRNNILSQNGGSGLVGGTSALPADPRYDGNAYFNNTTSARSNCDDQTGINKINPYQNVLDVTLTASPFTNPSSGDWTLNSTTGGGSSCRAFGTPGPFPGLTPVGATDMGALQHADSGSGGTGTMTRVGFLEG